MREACSVRERTATGPSFGKAGTVAQKVTPRAAVMELRVEIAELACLLRVRGVDPSMANRVENAYRKFDSLAEPQLIVDVQVDPKLSRRTPRPITTKAACGFFEVESYNFEGAVSVDDGRATVGVSPEWEAVDAFLRILYSLLLPTEKGVIVHASAVVDKGVGCIFAALPEGGKSTVAHLSGDRHILGDELVALKCVNGHVRVFATPFWNETHLAPVALATDVPVGALFLLHKHDRVHVEQLPPLTAAVEVLPHLFYEAEQLLPSQAVLDVLGEVVQSTRSYRLYFAPNEVEFWRCVGSVTQ